MAETRSLKHPFRPVICRTSRVLILGSFPSVISREKNFYYANRQNRFWPLMEELFHDSCGESIEDKTAFCYRHHIALSDVIASCTITGSSDASIRDVVVNDIAGLVRNTEIGTVFTTGSRASRLYDRYVDCGLRHIALPSTSSANARMGMDILLKEYEVIRVYAEKED